MQRDSTIGLDKMLVHVGAIESATDFPVSTDLEKGFGDDPATVAESVRLAALTGCVDASIEDATSRLGDPIYEHQLAVERVRAAVEAARSLRFPFTLTAPAETPR